MGDLSFKHWLLQLELVYPGEPSEKPMDMAAMMARGGGGPGAFATGTAPPKPFDGPNGVGTPQAPVPKINNGWAGAKRQVIRRLNPITPKGSMISKTPGRG